MDGLEPEPLPVADYRGNVRFGVALIVQIGSQFIRSEFVREVQHWIDEVRNVAVNGRVRHQDLAAALSAALETNVRTSGKLRPDHPSD